MFLMIIFYSINIYLEDRKNTFDYIMLSIFVIIFILFLINPKLFSNQHHFGKNNIFINISDNVIEWKLDKKHEVVKINIKDIQSISTSTGDVRFKMNDDSIKILKSKNIQN
jgi:hypothetical protein